MSELYKENHYVPRWYQDRFLPVVGQRKFKYLDLKPERFRDVTGTIRTRTALHRWGSKTCFKETDLYTVKYGQFESTDIEKFFFGKVDNDGKKAVEFFANYVGFRDGRFDSKPGEMFEALLNYMSIQRFRTPKGLRYLSALINLNDKNQLLIALQKFQNLHCAIWTEAIWSIADAKETKTKFIISDHPVTLYNRTVFPDSAFSRQFTDPDFRMNGTHVLFPLSPDRILILTHRSWVRNPYGSGDRPRPNPSIFRPAMFNFLSIQTGRFLSETEVNQINFIIKRRADRFIAAPEEDWLYPEDKIPSTHWRKLDDRYLLMPDPRSVYLGGSVVIGYEGGRSAAFDEYGRRPDDAAYSKETDQGLERRTLYAFQGEFARLFGRKRRGACEEHGRRVDEDSSDYHKHLLEAEKKFRLPGRKPRRNERAR